MRESGRAGVVVAVADEALREHVENAAREAGCALVAGPRYRGNVVIVAARDEGEDASHLLRASLAEGALGVVVLADARSLRQRLFREGAADVVSPRVDAWELARRIERIVGTKLLALRVAEQAREAEEQRALFQAVVDTIPVSLYAIDQHYQVVVWNRGREAGPFGKPRVETLGANLFDVVGDDDDLRAEFEEIFRTGVPRTSEVRGRAGSPPRVYRVEKYPMRLGSGEEVSHVIVFARDVTEQRALERSMAQAEKLAAIGRLAAGIAHEINNPLATIASCAEAMRTRLSEPLDTAARIEIVDDSKVIEEEAYRCKDILQSLLDFSRPSAEPSGPCDLARVVERTVRLIKHNPKLSRVDLGVDLAADLPRPRAHEDHLVEALMALVLNAADAAPEGRIVVRATRTAQGEPMIAVEDDGPGIPPEIRGRIFEPFFTTKPPGQGTGLGLSVVYGLLEAHGGRLVVDSEPGRGSRFEMVWPAGTIELDEVTR